MALESLLVNSITITKYSDPINVSGANVPTETVTTGVRASIQESSAAQRDNQDIEGAVKSGKAFFSYNPGVRTGDLLTWGTRLLEVAAPATDEAGRGILFTVRWSETL